NKISNFFELRIFKFTFWSLFGLANSFVLFFLVYDYFVVLGVPEERTFLITALFHFLAVLLNLFFLIYFILIKKEFKTKKSFIVLALLILPLTVYLLPVVFNFFISIF
ncbi:hypothetical protein ACFL08_05475, partial [Patescibacteria group bacterium]